MDIDSSYDQFDSNMASCSSMDPDWQIPKVEFSHGNQDSSVLKRFIDVLDQIDTRVEKLRKEALGLSEKRDVLLMSMDVIKNNELLHGLNEYEMDEINCYSQRINSRLATIDLCVKTVRDAAQEESLHQVNSLIDSLITSNDRIMARQRCQTFLNGCSFNDSNATSPDRDHVVDKKFEMAVLGCTLDDQKVVKKRLQALMTYLNKQTISD